MNYEQKYKEALERARKINIGEGVAAPPDWNTCEVIFPELKEIEDERIRKALLKNLTERFGTKGNMGEGLDMPDVLAWLEKQGEHECDCKYVGCHVNDVKRWCHKKQVEVLYENCNTECSEYLKQGEQKPIDKVEPKFKAGDKIIHKELGGDNPHKIIQVDMLDKKYRLEDGLVAHFSEEDDWELVEQKPTWFDLFFTDEEPETIDVPFGAKDSEFIKDEYFIPEGCEARIEGNKVIIEKIQEEKLTEFEQEIKNWMSEFLLGTEQPIPNKAVKQAAKKVLDLVRKELEKDYCIIEPFDVSDLKKEQRELGEAIVRTKALKDIPKWKKGNPLGVDCDRYTYETHGNFVTIYKDGYYITSKDLEKLPKEE